MIKRIVAIIICLSFTACATYRPVATTPDEVTNIDFNPKIKYKITMKNGYSVETKGNRIRRDSGFLHVTNSKDKIISSILMEETAKIEEKHLKKGATAGAIAGGTALAGAFTFFLLSVKMGWVK